jgi:hypothetical protein
MTLSAPLPWKVVSILLPVFSIPSFFTKNKRLIITTTILFTIVVIVVVVWQ